MAYNNGFPIGYPYFQYQQPIQQPSIPQPSIPSQQQGNSIIWVQGEAGAKSYMVAPNTTVQLWDSENPVIYLKSADASGMPSMKVLEYVVKGVEAPTSAQNPIIDKTTKYATKAEIGALRDEIEGIKTQLKGVKQNGKSSVPRNEQQGE